MGRPLTRDYPERGQYSHVLSNYALVRGGHAPLFLGGPDGPLMRTGNGGYIPAAQDPTDPHTWIVPVVWT